MSIFRKLTCWLDGHDAGRTIEIYSRQIVARDFITVGKQIIRGPSFEVEIVRGKFKCDRCGGLFIGMTTRNVPPF